MKTFCGYFDEGKCQSCSLIRMSYSEQLQRKEESLSTYLKDFSDWELAPSQSSLTEGFRNKVKMTVTGSLEKPIIGLGGDIDLDQGREILNCSLHHPFINELLHFMPEFITLCKLPPYQIKLKKGELKGIIVYYSESSQEAYLRFILRSKESLDRIKKNLSALSEKYPQLTSISANIQPIPHAILEGEEEVFFTEKKFIQHKIKDLSLRLSPQGFVQTNQRIAEKLYETAAQWVKELKIKKFSELFSGQGAFSFFVSPFIDSGLGIEINSEAVAEANRSANSLNLSHLNFICADAKDVEAEVNSFKPDMVLVNPPRRGLGESAEIFCKTSYPYIIYSSCSVESLAQDLKKLSPLYKIVKAQIFDMFPHTNHFETLVLLQKK
jgi:23S rRNA (uracil747-C5)-methyltransferase